MGAGASKDGEEIEVDDRYVSQSQSGSASGPISPRPRSERKSVGQVRKPSRMSMSRSTGKSANHSQAPPLAPPFRDHLHRGSQ